LKRRF